MWLTTTALAHIQAMSIYAISIWHLQWCVLSDGQSEALVPLAKSVIRLY